MIIAEAGVNHNGDCARALELVEVAARAGADVVKFQSFRANKLATAGARKADYQQTTTGREQSQFEMLRALELSGDDERRVAEACASAGITFMSTPFDADSATHLVRSIGVATLKVGSGDLTNAPLLLHLARFRLPIILSTGMATLAEVEQALGVIAFGYLREAGRTPTRGDFSRTLFDHAAWAELQNKVTLLHCTTEYPAIPHSINLTAMATLRGAFGLPVGFSDHSAGFHIAVAAVALGAVAIEKHFTVDRSLPGPDHRASLEPDELAAMIESIREVELAIGDGRKIPAVEEISNRGMARRSLVAAMKITRGEPYTADNVAVKRPGDGMSPEHYWELLGRPANRDYASDDMINESCLTSTSSETRESDRWKKSSS
ncbi:MAG TPA: N-acetylneuraminate synthase [Bradyrhizobium sp.]|jgi:N-acetylneuraminate synthase|uniref:N-acetylneuraminate synthase n=1 Tax=Bradyrhizobium sp. TaxID=376 RepID=UPI002C9D8290|nr:N-acetylneuraminate synthase [Bradyrhizobium sp.]HTB04904.1 N-acetylneuraminate synthase [Bradyrhizobium sp.]